MPQLKKPYSILIGESMGGLVTQCIRELPHMIIAGTTGGGKSVFMKQALLCLEQTSPYFQMYLLDLKGGVEMKEFTVLPNVVVAKNEKTAVLLLRKLKLEMERRFKYMEEKGYKKIEPERDKMDLIVVGVDEASVLYTKPGNRSAEGLLIQEARDLTDTLAKLARAAAIHLVLATQKVTKETIDTKIQENIGGRMCFRMNTLQGSLTVLGNKMGFELPDIPGRAIWSSGNKFLEVQAPFMSDEEIVRECELIKFDFESGKRKNFQDMLRMDAPANNTPDPAEMSGAA
jgi:S-DNA-T family DNA segregation ATPase FtsK/SpoIIIE